MGKTSDSGQCWNRLKLDLIFDFGRLPCALGQIMTGYDFLEAKWEILSNV